MSQDAYNNINFQFVTRPLMKADLLVNIFHAHQHFKAMRNCFICALIKCQDTDVHI